MGTFESHITIQANNKTALSIFQQLCQELKVKCLLIELPEGINNFQPMTSLYHKGSYERVLIEVNSLAELIREQGFKVTRVKIEALITNNLVPINDEEAKKLPESNYFEFHVLVNLLNKEAMEQLKAICREHQAHLSQNAFKKSVEGIKQYFVTMRLYKVGKQTAKAHFSKLLTELKQQGFKLSNRLQEYIIYDSNTLLDTGWIEPIL